MKQLYLQINDRIEGPYNRGELIYLYSQGDLPLEAMVREGEHGKWAPASQVLGISKRRKKNSSSSSGKTQREITGLKRRPATELQSAPEVEAPFNRSQVSDPQFLKYTGSEVGATAVPLAMQENRRKKLLLASVIILMLLVLLVCLLYWMFFSGQTGYGQTDAAQGGQVAQGDQNSSTESESLGTEQGKSQDETLPQSTTASTQSNSAQSQSTQPEPSQPVEKTQSSKSSSGMSFQPPEPKQGSMKSSEPPASYSVGTARFFGIEAEGPIFVYVVDCSGSMQGSRMELTKQELKKSISQLNLNQSFYVIFFSDNDYPMFFPDNAALRPLLATDKNVKQLEQWVDGFHTGGGTDPVSALLRALSLAPDSIFLMTDGDFDSQVADLLKSQNAGKVAIHTIAFQSRSGENLLKRIAKENSGQHRFVP